MHFKYSIKFSLYIFNLNIECLYVATNATKFHYNVNRVGFWPFLLSGIRPDIRFHSLDIRLEKWFKIKNNFDKLNYINI